MMERFVKSSRDTKSSLKDGPSTSRNKSICFLKKDDIENQSQIVDFRSSQREHVNESTTRVREVRCRRKNVIKNW